MFKCVYVFCLVQNAGNRKGRKRRKPRWKEIDEKESIVADIGWSTGGFCGGLPCRGCLFGYKASTPLQHKYDLHDFSMNVDTP